MMGQQNDHSKLNGLSHKILKAAFRVHSVVGPGLLESLYQRCLAIEFQHEGLAYERERPVQIRYRDTLLDEIAYRFDFVVENTVIVELKAQSEILPIHRKQLLTYLKISQKPLGLLINFNTISLRDGIVRMIYDPAFSG